MKKISILYPTYNEQENIHDIISKTKEIISNFHNYIFEIVIIDNNSKDETVNILKEISKKDKNVKIIINNRNYGPINSPTYGLLQLNSDAVISLPADFQHPLELIPKYIEEWEKGSEIVLGKKTSSKESKFLYFIRSAYYKLLNKISDIKPEPNTNGEGLYSRKVLDILRKIDDPYPYLRGLIFELGFKITFLTYKQNQRKSGISKNNFFSLMDFAMLGIVKHSKIPMRFITIVGFSLSLISFFIGLIYFVYKLLFWDSFQVGIAPLLIGFFFFVSFMMFLQGLVGEYISVILAHQRNLPLVIEKERINFD